MEEGSSSGLANACAALPLVNDDERVIVEVEEVEPEVVDYQFTAVGRVVTDRSIKFVVFRDVMAKAWKPVKGVHISELVLVGFCFGSSMKGIFIVFWKMVLGLLIRTWWLRYGWSKALIRRWWSWTNLHFGYRFTTCLPDSYRSE